jgi:hypothetical protein
VLAASVPAASVLAAAALATLALASPAAACVCVEGTLETRLDGADAAVVGTVVAERAGELNGAPQRLLTVDVEQRVKGDVERTIEVRSPSGTDCDVEVPRDEPVGLLLTRAPEGGWLATACSVVAPGELVAEGGEPRGGPIKVAIGIAILALVLLFARYRLRKGSRPELPGAPEP